MNNVFSLQRFMKISRKMMRENWRELAMSLVMLEGAILLMMIFGTLVTAPTETDSLDVAGFQVEGGKVLFMVFGCIAGSMMFGGMSTSRQRLSVLMTPASILEKFVSRWVTYAIGYAVAFVVLFVVGDMLNFVIFKVLMHSKHFVIPFLGTLRPQCYELFHWGVYGGVYLTFTSLFALGSLLWPKRSLLKTFFVLVIIIMTYWIIAYWATSVAPEAAGGGGYVIEESLATASQINHRVFSAGLVMAIIFYVLAYYRFKESEIIDRW
ncbi:MAG: hypothetical protein K2L14_02020 [Duncaniella sp.]|nr:hypothetical protein [Duncaniella sp.]